MRDTMPPVDEVVRVDWLALARNGHPFPEFGRVKMRPELLEYVWWKRKQYTIRDLFV